MSKADKSPAKTSASSRSAKAANAPKKPVRSGKDDAYTKPELREKLKEEVKAGDKGGRPGQWSARKAQLLAAEYKHAGGDYKEGGPTEGQKHLQDWTKEKWQTADKKPAARGKTTARYLPAKAWDKLTPAEQKATDAKKRKGSRAGKQFVANTKPAKKARKSAAKS